MKVAVVGAGSWGSTFAALLVESGHEVTLACRDPEQARAIEATGRNPRYVVAAELSRVSARPLAETAFDEVELLVVAVPSRAFADVVASLPPSATPVLSLVKGLDPATGERLSTRVDGRSVAVLSGPNHAEEIAEGLPAAAVVASEDEGLAELVQHALMSRRFRVYVNADVVGVELCAAAKNVIALAAGAVDGLDMGDNAKAALITRGLAEMARLGASAGARPETFSGLAGMGDLVVTCWSRHSRNRRAGELIARGVAAEDAAGEIGMVVEGIPTAPALRRFSRAHDVELPLTEAICDVLEGGDVRAGVAALMARPPTEE